MPNKLLAVQVKKEGNMNNLLCLSKDCGSESVPFIRTVRFSVFLMGSCVKIAAQNS